jgi:hypothetical protein
LLSSSSSSSSSCSSSSSFSFECGHVDPELLILCHLQIDFFRDSLLKMSKVDGVKRVEIGPERIVWVT